MCKCSALAAVTRENREWFEQEQVLGGALVGSLGVDMESYEAVATLKILVHAPLTHDNDTLLRGIVSIEDRNVNFTFVYKTCEHVNHNFKSPPR